MVQALVHKYQHLEVLHPLLQKLFESPEQKELFTSITQHNYNVLMTRSQKLDDHEVNVYEKAFCVLMENEDGRIGGLEIYVEKILGVGELEGCAGDEEKEKSMLKEVAVRALLERGKRCLVLRCLALHFTYLPLASCRPTSHLCNLRLTSNNVNTRGQN